MRVVTLVPYRPANDRQRWLWDQVEPMLADLGFPIYVGEPRGEAWARGQAVNVASEKAGDWDVALIADCDTVPEEGSIRRAIAWVQDTGGAVRPHGERRMLNQKGTLLFCQRGPAALQRRLHFERAYPGGGLLVVTRDAWEKVGGYDESYIGWYAEDSDFNLRLLRHASWDRLPGTAWHLWHPRGDEHKASPESVKKYRRLMVKYRNDMQAWSTDKGLIRPDKVF